MLIASIPRSGSTYMLRCIYNLGIGNTTPDEYRENKIHHPMYDPGGEAIFTFRAIEKVIESTFKNRFDDHSFANCGYFGKPKDIYTEDFLNFEYIFDYWTSRSNTLCIRYESIPNYTDAIEKYVGHEIDWIPYHNSETEAKQISKTYKRLKAKIDAFDNLKIIP